MAYPCPIIGDQFEKSANILDNKSKILNLYNG